MTPEEQAAYEAGKPFSYRLNCRLMPVPGPVGGGVYIVQKPAAALREALLDIKNGRTPKGAEE